MSTPTFRPPEKEILEIFDNIPVMITVFDAGGRMQYVNAEWERTFGYRRAAFIGRVERQGGVRDVETQVRARFPVRTRLRGPA
jgi:PAS domain S-box-containing protein